MNTEPKIIYEKVCNGDSITDEELILGIQFFGALGTSLFRCGDVFRLAALEAQRTFMKLDGFQKARREK